MQKKGLIETLKTYYNRDRMMQHLNQSQAYQAPDYSSQDDLGAVEDDIIAITLKIVVEIQYKPNSHSMPVLPIESAPASSCNTRHRPSTKSRSRSSSRICLLVLVKTREV